jgi:hypothetical protein
MILPETHSQILTRHSLKRKEKVTALTSISIRMSIKEVPSPASVKMTLEPKDEVPDAGTADRNRFLPQVPS